MRIFTAAIVTETNTFSPIPTGLGAFDLHGVQHGRRNPIQPTNELATLVRWRELAERDGHTVVESIGAVAEPGGRTVRAVYEAFRDELLDDLRAAMPVDAVLLYLHGAMAAEDYDDCEGDILARVRAIVGIDTVVGAELDPHSHLTPSMLQHATVLLTYDEYPHTDIIERGEALYRLCVAAARKEIDPVTHAFDCRMTGLFPTTTQPMRKFVDDLKSARSGRVLSTSLVHGFPWGDVADGGVKCLAITDGDPMLAQQTAERFGRTFWSLREAVQLHAMSIDEALDKALASNHTPVVLADVADNAGGGAPGDSTFILQRLLERNVTNAVSGVYYDPTAVQLCFEAGEGATLDLRCGGKLGTTSGAPLDLRVTVRKLSQHHAQDSMDDSAPVPLGAAAWVDTGGVQVVLASIRSQVFAPNAFTALGISLEDARIVVLKSSHHFWGKFAPIAAAVLYVDSPGALRPHFANIGYKKRNGNYWPRVPNPFAAS
ncbi:MAG TPA: M81 family metallopeptidase [Candidatus Baltobacteraceae bacterium]|nr:M81 family metallopeptidase [Candidatus Baltobacteraceae bacterium]